MKLLQVVAAVVTALIVQTVLGRYFVWLNDYVDLFTVLVATFGLVRGRMAGMFIGTTAGLIQDVSSGGLLGLNGISKTTIGYLAGVAGRHLIVRGLGSRVLFYLVAAAADLLIIAAVGQLAQKQRVLGEGLTPLYVCAANALLGVLFMRWVEPEKSTDAG